MSDVCKKNFRMLMCALLALLLLVFTSMSPCMTALAQGNSAEPSEDSQNDSAEVFAEGVETGEQDLGSGVLALLSDSTDMKASYVTTYDGLKDMPQSEDNDWQIVRESYNEAKQGAGKYSYSEEDAVRLQKAVIANGSENDFQIYLNVEPQLSWDEFFKSLDNYSTHNNSNSFNPSSGCSRLLSQDEFDNLPESQKSWYAKINVTYQLTNGSYSVVRYGNFFGPNGDEQIQNVKNGSYAWSSEKFNTNGLIRGVDWRALVTAAASNSNLSLVIDARDLEKQFSFADKPVYPKSVSDPMGESIIFKGLVSADTGSINAPAEGSLGGTVEWQLPTATPPDPPYYSTQTKPGTIPGTNQEGTVTVLENVVAVERNGKLTAYYSGILEMRYGIALDTSAEGFQSCGNPASAPSEKATYATNGKTSLVYQVEDATKTTDFPLPAVKGLLYDLELKKIDEHSKKGLSGAVFTLLGEDGKPVTGKDGNPVTAVSENDGSVKFHNLALGVYSAKETNPPKGYAADDASSVGPYELCWTKNRALSVDHYGLHDADWASDASNMLPSGELPQVTNRRTLALVVLKQDADTKAPLEGVGFSLIEDDGDGSYSPSDKPARVWLDADMSNLSSSGATNAEGRISFYGIEPGTYWLLETRALAGYRLLDEPIKMTVTNDFDVFFHESMVAVVVDDSNVVRISVDNSKIPVLPKTGSHLGLALGLIGSLSLVTGLLAMVSLRAKNGRRCSRK